MRYTFAMAQRPAICPSDVTLSVAQPGDLDSIIAIEQQAFPTPWSRTALNTYIGDNGFIVCQFRERLVGYVLVGLQMPTLLDRLERFTSGLFGNERSAEVVGHVMNIAIHAGFRSCGLGRYLLGMGLAYLEGLGASRVELEVRINNPHAIQLYESEGFCIVDKLKSYYQNGDDAFLMSKSF